MRQLVRRGSALGFGEAAREARERVKIKKERKTTEMPTPPDSPKSEVSVSTERAFYLAIKENDAAKVEQMIAFGAVSVNELHPDKKNQTALHFAASENAVSVAKILIAKHSVLDARDSQGSSPLH